MGRRKLPNPHHYGVLKAAVDVINSSGWTQKELEKVSGTSQGFISQLCTGHITRPGIANVEVVLQTLGYNLTITRRQGPLPTPPSKRRVRYAGQEDEK